MEDLTIIKRCPRFEFCSAPRCPLDPLMQTRFRFPEEQKCTLGKSIRLKLGNELQNKGLFPKELGGIKSWNSRTPESKESTLKYLASGGIQRRITSVVQKRKEESDYGYL